MSGSHSQWPGSAGGSRQLEALAAALNNNMLNEIFLRNLLNHTVLSC